MRPGLRLATSNVFVRSSRTLLLIAVVALSAALIAAVTAAMSSVQGSLSKRLTMVVGTADARVHPSQAGKPFDAGILDVVRTWPEVESALPRLESNLTLRGVRPVWKKEGDFAREVRAFSVNTLIISLGSELDQKIRPIDLAEGRLPQKDGEIALSQVLLERLRGREGKDARRSSRLSQLTSRLADTIAAGDMPKGLDLGPEKAASLEEAVALNAKADIGIGGRIQIVRFFGGPMEFTIVGVTKSELLGGRPQAWVTRPSLEKATGQAGKLTNIDIVFRKGVDANTAVGKYKPVVLERGGKEGLNLETTEKVSTGFKKNLQNNDIPLMVASVMAFLSAAFIITTGMTVNIAERRRELAVLRCIGATRWQVAEAQLWSGLGIGVIGAAIGVPLGLGVALAILEYFRTDLKIELFVPTWRLLYAGLGAVVAALLGAVWPAWKAARLSPLKALTSRAEVPKRRGILLTLVVAVALIAVHPQPLLYGIEFDIAVPLYLGIGLPAMLIGYFLLGVPLLAGLTRVFGVLVARVMGVQPVLLVRSLVATPYRYGLTAGALMTGLALMVATWTQGRAVAEDWLDRIRFPDVFVLGTNLKLEHQQKLSELDFVTKTVAISLMTVESKEKTQTLIATDGVTYIGFQPRPFFELARLTWVQGDVETAVARMEQGGAVIVAREFFNARGKGVGEKVTLGTDGRWIEFEIVGVVSSPGLDLVNQYFEIGGAFAQTAVHSVFGTREDLSRILGGTEPTIQMIQVGLKDDPSLDEVSGDPKTDASASDSMVASAMGQSSDTVAETKIREALEGTNILDVGNGRKLKNGIRAVLERSMMIISVIAVTSMLVACMGVANMIVAAIDARQFEFGVLRAVGARRGMVLRLVLAEAVMVSLAAMVLGTCMGLQAVWAGQIVDEMLLGIELDVRPPWGPIAAGCGIVLVMAMGAAAPAVIALSRRKPRELLAAVRG
ncbi:MAG: FtsX-like permease family protein [Tepidisphaera sp.]